MIQEARAARLQWRLTRVEGWGAARVLYVRSQAELDGPIGSYAGQAYYMWNPHTESWTWIGKWIDGADTRIRKIENAAKVKPPPPTPAEVFGVVLQVIGAVFGVVSKLPKKGK